MADRRARILVADDEPPVVQLLSDDLTEQGFEVSGAHSGVQALARLSEEQPDVVLRDVRMPELDGVEVLRRIRENYPRLAVLMVSGNADVELAKETVALGAFDYILKPVDFPYLLRAIDKMLAATSVAAHAALNQIRTLLRFGRDLSDFSDDEHRRLEGYVAKARRSGGLA